MSGQDTSMGGQPGAFPETVWSMVSQLGHQTTAAHRAGLEDLCRRYWKPVYRYVRIRWAKSDSDAKDLTQAFFLWLVDGDALTKFEPERGGFRKYVKVLLGGFVGHQNEAMRALKRGGGKRLVPLDGIEEFRADPQALDPETAFDRAWFSETLQQALTQVKGSLLAEGKERQIQIYEEYERPTSGNRPTRAELAKRHQVKETDVANYLFEVREAMRNEIRKRLREVTVNEDELEQEWNRLVGS